MIARVGTSELAWGEALDLLLVYVLALRCFGLHDSGLKHFGAVPFEPRNRGSFESSYQRKRGWDAMCCVWLTEWEC